MITAEELLAHPVGLMAYLESFKTKWQKKKKKAELAPAFLDAMDKRASEQAELMAERVPLVLDQIKRHKPGETVNKRVIAATRGWYNAVSAAFDLAIEQGIIEMSHTGKRYRRTDK